MKKILTLATMFLLCLSTFSMLLPNALGNAVPEFSATYSTNIPLIDGSLADPVWGDANSYEISLMRIDGAETVSATVYFVHDCTNIYIGFEIFAGQHDIDKFALFFDEGDDGGYGSGTRDGVLTSDQEDFKAYTSVIIWPFPTNLGDGCVVGGAWTTHGLLSEIDFDAKCVFVVDHWDGEFSIPFVGNDGGTLDMSDLVCTTADTIGIKIQYYDGGDWFTGNYFYPAGDHYEIETFTTLGFLPCPGVIPEVPLGTIVASAAMIIALAAYVAVPRWRRKQKQVNP